MSDYHRWNFGTSDTSVTVCKNNHDKCCPCEYEELSPEEALKIIDDLRAQLFDAKAIHKQEKE